MDKKNIFEGKTMSNTDSSPGTWHEEYSKRQIADRINCSKSSVHNAISN